MATGTIKVNVPRSDIINNLTTNDATKVLSAAQGYALNRKIATQPQTYTTFDAVKAGILEKHNSLPDGGVGNIAFLASTYSGGDIPSGYRYTGTITRFGTNYFTCNLVSTDGINICVGYNGGNWSFVNLKKSLYTKYSNSWVDSLSVDLPKQGAYLFVSQRYVQIEILMRFQNGNTTSSNISGNNWTFTQGTNGNITATASNKADYYIIPLMPTM